MTKVFFKTFGCTLNQSDSEIMQGILVDVGFEIVESADESEVIVLNTCTVKKPTENKVLKYLSDIRGLKKYVVVSGCMAQAMSEKLEGYSLLGPHNLSQIIQVIEETMHGSKMVVLTEHMEPRYNIPKVRKNPIIEILPICSGCMGECTYCIVRKARGGFYSYDKKEIISQAEKSIRDGARELWLTAQDTGCYGAGIGTSLPDLVKDLAAINGDFKIRVGMMNPNHVPKMIDELIEIYKNDKVFKFLHIPVQSGSDRILGVMRRKYTVKDFRDIITNFRKHIPDITIATDMICGYPGETNEEFEKSVKLIEEVQPDVVNVSRFFSRPWTQAAKSVQLPGREIKNRSRRLSSIFDWVSFEHNRKWRNWAGSIMIHEKGKDDSWVGRNYAYKPVVVCGSFKPGQEVWCRIVSVTSHYLIGLSEQKS